MKNYTLIKGEVKEINVLIKTTTTSKVEAFDLHLGRIESIVCNSEIFNTKKDAKKYFN